MSHFVINICVVVVSVKEVFSNSICKNCYRKDVIGRALARTTPFYCNMAEDLFLSGVFFSCAERVVRLEACLHHYDRGTGMSSAQASFTPAKLKRDWASVTACGEHLLAFMDTYNPAYADMARKRVNDSKKYLLFEHVVYGEDWEQIRETLTVLEGPFLDFACERLIPFKMKRKLGLITAENAQTEYWKMMEE